MRTVLHSIAKEAREAVPAVLFFLVLFHLLAIMRAAVLDDFRVSTLRAVGATIGALLVAKAILVVEALPLAHLAPARRIYRVLWKTALYGTIALLFRLLEDLVASAVKHGGLVEGLRNFRDEAPWPLFAVLALWVFGGLFLYCLCAELVRALGRDEVRRLLFEARSERHPEAPRTDADRG